MFLIALTAGLWTTAFLLHRHERQLRVKHHTFGTDLFAYSKHRAMCRLLGVGVLSTLGGTLLLFELLPPSTPTMGWLYIAGLFLQVLLLLAIGVIDMWETAKTANPADQSRQKE